MATDIVLPDLGEGVDSGDVLEVLVSEGDTIQKEQGIVELETDKATITVPSPHAGKVTKVHVSEGDAVEVGKTLISVETSEAGDEEDEPSGDQDEEETAEVASGEAAAEDDEGEAQAEDETAEAEDETDAEEEAEEQQKAPRAKKSTKKAGRKKPQKKTQSSRASAPSKPSQPDRSPHSTRSTESTGHVAAGPSIRRFAREVGVDLTEVTGTGPGGRISREDVLDVVRRQGRSQKPLGGGAPSRSAVPQTTSDESDSYGPVRIEKMSKIRKTIAQKMHESWTTCPRVTNFDDADVTDLEEFRQSSKEDYARQGIKLTSLPFVIKAVALALRHHPMINASIDLEAGQIIYKEYVNIGIAVDTDRGLIVPSLRSADKLSIPDISRALSQIAEDARGGNFSLEDLRGSTFTISNLGAVGGTYSTPIINVPETAILLLGRSRKMPVVIGNEIKVRLMMPLSIAYDHRLIDGATAARFLNDVIGYLKAPSRLLLAL